MSAATCAVLATVFPLILLAIAVDGRNVSPKLRRLKWHGRMVAWAVTCSVVGLVSSVIGVQTNGLSFGWALWTWIFFAGALFTLVVVVLMLLATAEVELVEPKPEPSRWQLFRDFLRGKRS